MLSVGVGMRPGTDVTAIVTEALRGIAERPDVIATIDRRASEASAVAARFGCAVRTFTAEELAAQPVPAPSGLAAAASRAAASATLGVPTAAGPGARLLIGKHAAGSATVAVAVS